MEVCSGVSLSVQFSLVELTRVLSADECDTKRNSDPSLLTAHLRIRSLSHRIIERLLSVAVGFG